MTARNDVGEPIVQTLGSSVDGCVRAIDGDVVSGEEEQGSLLGVSIGDGLEAREDEGV